MPIRVLVTGFEPFDGASYNPSGEAALSLRGRTVVAVTAAGPRLGIIEGLRLPVVWEASADMVRRLVVLRAPHVVICLGEGDTSFRVEQLADDVRVPSLLDNKHRRPRSPHGIRNVALPTMLPREAIEAALMTETGGNVRASDDAGGFICNEVFYALMQTLREPSVRRTTYRAGFIHVPNHTVVPARIPQAAVDHAVMTAIEVTMRSLDDAEALSAEP